MIRFQKKLEVLPEQPGEKRISVHWFFLPTALLYLAGGIACLHEAPHERAARTLMYGGWALISLGLFVLLTFVLSEMRLRQGGKIASLFTIRVRPLLLAGFMAGFMAFTFILYGMLPPAMTLTIPFIWVFGGAFIWNGIVRYFRNHPPKS
jgi:hypothetical protein